MTAVRLTHPPKIFTFKFTPQPLLFLRSSTPLLLLLPLFFGLQKTNSTNKIKLVSPSTFLPKNLLIEKGKEKMRYTSANFLKQRNIFFIRGFIILLFTSLTVKINLCFSNTLPLKTLELDGHFNFDEVHHAAKDFGNRFQFLPAAVLHPKSVFDIAITIRHIWQMGTSSELTVAARGHGHSLQGQSQAHRGVVINMESLKNPGMQIHTEKFPYVDVYGGELWINILHETLKFGLAPKSWTDYLHLTVGGTLSNAGISGQAFRHGPQISNVHQLEVVTGLLKK